MFSWTTPARRPDGDATSGGGSLYPGQRVSTTAAVAAAAASSSTTTTTTAATAIRGTIRPPDYTREQHLESYLKDVTLQRSTRRVSAGTWVPSFVRSFVRSCFVVTKGNPAGRINIHGDGKIEKKHR